ncbi:hypothetical protein JK203_14580 [Gluconobacter cerinus]|uniref:hypothetical protein n=1 Tax=Gluconobacter cerinus TaxID=38307 RepID=UPI001B8D7A00|nr:hypothetical protein [Gluconobacter cerinus]MBS1042059.1 hypothetical protein [Gluconobacter cerinus]MBS1048647.1 hypothetical protein [Gluconobacter cerinus]
MALQRLNLSGGSYDARAVSVAAQRCLNLYGEPVPVEEGEPVRFAYYLTPGLRKIAQMTGAIRCLYQTTQGDLIVVAGSRGHVFARSGDWQIDIRTLDFAVSDGRTASA